MPETLYIIDAYAQFFRNYHAIRTPMTSPVTKEPTNMTFGFVGMLLKLLKAEGSNLRKAGKPDYLAVALDVGGDYATFRSELYPAYKATRKPPPDDLAPQVKRCLEMLAEVGVPVIGIPGYEADDVMATLVSTQRALHPELRVRMVSKDKDLKQLLDPASDQHEPYVELFDVHTDSAFDARTLAEETGLMPGQVVDMLSLMGDTVDNVPGVEGVGDKTAALLIAEYKTLDNLLAHAGEIKGKRGERLREAAPRLALSKKLVTLRSDLPIAFELESARISQLRLERLIPILRELGFNRYQDEVKALLGMSVDTAGAAAPASAASTVTEKPVRKRVAEPEDAAQGGLFDLFAAEAVKAAPARTDAGQYHCVSTRDQLTELAAALRSAPIFAFDTETMSLKDKTLCGLSFSIEPGAGWYVPVRSPACDSHLNAAQVLEYLGPILADPTQAKCGHNLKFDMLVLRKAGAALDLSHPDSLDSMVASYIIDASRSSHGLDSLALALLGRTNISITELIGTGKQQRTFDSVPVDSATCYAAEDADVALQLRNMMAPQLTAMQLSDLFTRVEMPLVEVLAELEFNGVLVDPDELDRQRHRLATQIERLKTELNTESRNALGRTFDPDSPKQLGAALFNKPDDEVSGLGIKPVRKTKTGNSTDAEVLDKLAQDETLGTHIPKLILEYRQLTKLVSTYLVALKDAIDPATKRIHTSFNQTVAATGRLASSDPNLQNIPIRTEVGRDIRKAFIAPPGHSLVTADYSQIELRLLAHLAQDPALIEAFRMGEDIHTAVAAQIHGVSPKEVTKDQRSGAKMVNFGIVYGITGYGLARRLKIEVPAAEEIITGYKKRFAGITTFLQECIEQARRQGYVTTMLGRRRPIPDVDSNQPSRRALAERLAINSVVQGSAADLIKLAMVNIHRELREQRSSGGPLARVKMLLQIHDELVFESPDEAAAATREMITARMESAMALRVPLKADAYVGKNWFEGK